MANKVYIATESGITFSDSGVGVDAYINLNNLAFGAGAFSNQYDRGTGSKPQYHKVKGIFEYATPPQSGEAIELYLFESDGTYIDGNIGATSGALTTLKRNNGMFIGAVICDIVAASSDIIGSFNDVPICSRYYSVGVWNASTGDNLRASGLASRVIVTPIPDEIQ